MELDTNKMKLKEAEAFKLHLDLHGESKASEVIGFLINELQKLKQERDEAVELLNSALYIEILKWPAVIELKGTIQAFLSKIGDV